MMKLRILSVIAVTLILNSCADKAGQEEDTYDAALDSLRYESEANLKNIRQLTFGGDNAEAYWSYDNTRLIMQATNDAWGAACDQIFVIDVDGIPDHQAIPQMLSTGKGRTTCSFFMPDGKSILYASTHLADEDCPPVPPRSVDGHYVWPVYESYDIFIADLNGNIERQLTDEAGYDAEATISPLGDKIVFTSMRSGDLELYLMDLDGSNVTQITDELGYDGGAFFSPDGQQLIFRASRPQTEEEVATYTSLLEKGLVQPTEMELFVVNIDGTGMRQITSLGGANWAPYFHPSGEKVIFSSNHQSEAGFPFNLFMINLDGTGLVQITFDEAFDSFPMFSPDGKRLSFSSNRNNGGTRATNVFVADWLD